MAINVGARYLFQDYRRSDVRKHEFSPRVALAVKPIENLVLRGAWGLYHQPIDLMTIPIEDGVTDVGRAEQAIHYVIGGDYVLPGRFLVRAEGYYKKLANLAGQIPDYGRQTQISPPADSGEVRGFDFFVNGVVSERLTGSFGYAFSFAKARGTYPAFFSFFGREFFRDFDQRHTIALNGSYQVSSSWHLHASWRFHTGNPTTHLEHTPVQLSDGSLICERHFGDFNADRLPAYHSLDLRFTKTSPHRNWQLTWYNGSDSFILT